MSVQVNPRPPRLPLPSNCLKARDHRHHELHDNNCGDIGIDPHSGYAHVPHRPAAEEVHHSHQCPDAAAPSQELAHGFNIRAGHRDVGNKAENYQKAQGKQDLLPQVRLTKGIDHCLKQLGPSVSSLLSHY